MTIKKATFLPLFLLLLHIHVTFASTVYKGCPFYPIGNRKPCKSKRDCPKGQSCCRYFTNKRLCTPSQNSSEENRPTADSSACYINGMKVGYGQPYTSIQDPCYQCICYGYDSIHCRRIKC